jgi:hypothetical protein
MRSGKGALLDGLAVTAVLAGIGGKTLCVAASHQGPLQGPLLWAIAADLGALAFRISSPAEVSKVRMDGIIFSIESIDGLLIYLGAALFVLAMKRMASQFSEPMLEKHALRLLVSMIFVFPTLLAIVMLSANWLQPIFIGAVLLTWLALIVGIGQYARLTHNLQDQILK